MINVEGYKAFSGIMRISEKRLGGNTYNIQGDWLYEPQKERWYVSHDEGCISCFSPYYYNLDIIKDFTEK